MKKLTRITMLFALTAFAVSCDDNEDLFDDIIGDEDIELMVTDKQSTNVDVYVSELDAGATSFNALVDFTSSNDDMKRVYVTEDYFGAGDEPYSFKGVSYDDKLDGSLDLAGSNSGNFSFDIPFDVYSTTTEGEIVYTIWATSGRGDFRDPSKRLSVGLGTITVHYGTGSNPNTPVKEFETTITLDAPLAAGTSETFFSLLDGQTYIINEGAEMSAFWDFGYYYGNTNEASFASVVNYPALFDHDGDDNTALVNVIDFVKAKFPEAVIEESELHEVYFKSSTMDFDAVTMAIDLDGISASTDQRINMLAAGDIVEFVDNYGKKGLIKVISIDPGFTGSITIDVKVQP